MAVAGTLRAGGDVAVGPMVFFWWALGCASLYLVVRSGVRAGIEDAWSKRAKREQREAERVQREAERAQRDAELKRRRAEWEQREQPPQ